MALVELVRCHSSVEAAVIRTALDAAGIESFVFDTEMSWIGDALPCRVMVDEDDLDEAQKVLPDD